MEVNIDRLILPSSFITLVCLLELIFLFFSFFLYILMDKEFIMNGLLYFFLPISFTYQVKNHIIVTIQDVIDLFAKVDS